MKLKPDFLFEVSWEVCHKIGGIYTVLSTKSEIMKATFGDQYICIGPDKWTETTKNPYFIEDENLLPLWKSQAATEGLNIRIGRWNIPSEPIAVLVDFTPFIMQKDKIFAYYWESNELDSIAGNWDYIEPVMFGYAVGKVIESFYKFHIDANHKIIAHFHEWMTGSGALYLNNEVPQVGTVFTTHATVLGRAIAGNLLPLYKDLEAFDPTPLSNQFNVRAKYSVEKKSAVYSDVFTTVSNITANECKHLLKTEPDFVTPNGYQDSILTEIENNGKKADIAREKLIQVTQALLNQKLSDKAQFVLHSGRYEFKNKGTDRLIDALGKINAAGKLENELVVFIAIPSNIYGVNTDLVNRLDNPDFNQPTKNQYLTHGLHNHNQDLILNRLNNNALQNSLQDKVKVVFVPSYLNGNDGVFNLDYYDFLLGFDFTAFPSYYEPWGYTPMESLAYQLPTVTTELAGFGKWVKQNIGDYQDACIVLERKDDAEDEFVEHLAQALLKISGYSDEQKEKSKIEASNIISQLLWSKLAEHYFDAYNFALQETQLRYKKYNTKLKEIPIHKDVKPVKIQDVEWKKLFVKSKMPEKLSNLKKLSQNLWWCWDEEAKEMFASIDPILYEKYEKNPVALLENLSMEKLEKLKNDKGFLSRLNSIYQRFENYMSAEKPEMSVAYFSMEYGLHDTVKIFSGGLGVLAGDYLKECSDSNLNLTGIGLLYRYGYFTQKITYQGEQVSEYLPQKFTHMPLKPVKDKDNQWLKVTLVFPGRNIYAKVWRLDVGRIPLYLMDTDMPENQERDRFVTHQLYGGDRENRLKQELLLGVGGIRLLEALDMKRDVYHINEGHAAFIGLERLRILIQRYNYSYHQATEIVRMSSLFTTHTPVPAGHDYFSEDLLRTYISHYPERLNISWNDLMELGSFPGNKSEEFSMSVLAANLSQEMNGVSKIHGAVSREMFKSLFKGYFAEELYISHVTNGVHFGTWASKEWKELYAKYLQINHDQLDFEKWQDIYQVPDEEIWNLRKAHKLQLTNYLRKRLEQDFSQRQENPSYIMNALDDFDENLLTLGFARRFATYKRAHLLFTNIDRLNEIINKPDKPVQIVFAGKAHPADKAGQDLIKEIVRISRLPQFTGKIFFVENYDLELGKRLTGGVDVWLNTPTRPLEASGTSGEKAVMNGVLNLSVLDGWWKEGYVKGAGWAITDKRQYANQNFQDELDAGTIYNLLEEEIIPLYYDRNENGIPEGWIASVKKNIAEIVPHFTMRRMVNDYEQKFYRKLYERTKILKENDYKKVRTLAKWKEKVEEQWSQIEVLSIRVPDVTNNTIPLGEMFEVEVVLKLNELRSEDVGLEMLFANKVNDRVENILFAKELTPLSKNGSGKGTYTCSFSMEYVGVLDFVFRMYPKNDLLPHKQDMKLVRWF